MTTVHPKRWEFWLDGMPMPEDATEETLWAMYEVVKQMKDREYAAEQIKWYESLWRVNFPKYQANTESETLKQTMKLIKEGIMRWREVLTDG